MRKTEFLRLKKKAFSGENFRRRLEPFEKAV